MTPFFGVKRRKKRGYCTKNMYFMELVEKQHKNVNLNDQNSLENTENNNKNKIHWKTIQKKTITGPIFGKLGSFSA